MNSILRARRKSSIAAALVSFFIGGVLFTFPETSVRWMCMALGASLLVLGVWYLVSYFRGRGMLSAFQLDLFLGIVLAVLGLWLLLRPESVISLLQYVFGAFILLHGLVELQAAFHIRRAGFAGWAPAMIVSLLTVLLAAVILLNPFASFAALVMLIGAVLIYNGVIDLFLIFRLSRLFAAKEKASEPLEASYTEAKEDDPSAPGGDA